MALFEKLAAANPGETAIQRRLVISYERTGEILTTYTESYAEAVELHRKQLKLAADLAAAAPLNTDLARIAAYAHAEVARGLSLMGDSATAEPHFRRAIDEFQRLSAADPQSVQYRTDIAFGLGVLADAAIESGKPADAFAPLQRALAILADLPADNSPDGAANRFRIGKAYLRLGRRRDAEIWLQRGQGPGARFALGVRGGGWGWGFSLVKLVKSGGHPEGLGGLGEELSGFGEALGVDD